IINILQRLIPKSEAYFESIERHIRGCAPSGLYLGTKSRLGNSIPAQRTKVFTQWRTRGKAQRGSGVLTSTLDYCARLRKSASRNSGDPGQADPGTGTEA